ncbi:MAG TPA: hypothetical protein ACQGQH_09365 [Xylella sp.]
MSKKNDLDTHQASVRFPSSIDLNAIRILFSQCRTALTYCMNWLRHIIHDVASRHRQHSIRRKRTMTDLIETDLMKARISVREAPEELNAVGHIAGCDIRYDQQAACVFVHPGTKPLAVHTTGVPTHHTYQS